MRDNELVWAAEPKNPITSGNISGVVTYGAAPKDWINKLTPPAPRASSPFSEWPTIQTKVPVAILCWIPRIYDCRHASRFAGGLRARLRARPA